MLSQLKMKQIMWSLMEIFCLFFFLKLHFHGGICAQIASLQPRMLQIHLLCVRMLGVSFLGLHVPVLVSRTKHRGSTLLVPLTHSTKTG